MGKLDGKVAVITGATSGMALRREMGRPEEIASVALFPASDDSSTSMALSSSPTAAPP
jgi:NAD(P)-dependent dehydrogenase (short-subunit alcohol dehydrogenase family)